MAVGEQFLISGFKSFIKDVDLSSVSKDFLGCKYLITEYLSRSDITYFFDSEATKKKDLIKWRRRQIVWASRHYVS